MKAIFLFLVLLLLSSCKVSSQRTMQRKVQKDTLLFNFDKSYFVNWGDDENIFVSENDLSSLGGINFEILKIHKNLKLGKILEFKKFSGQVSNDIIFERLDDNIIIFVDSTGNQPLFYEMMPGLFILD